MVTFPSFLSPGLRSLQARKNRACRGCALLDQRVPVPPGPPKRLRSPVAGSLLGSRETETKATIGHGGSQAADLSAEGGQRAPCHCTASIQSTLREAGLRALRGGLCSLPATPIWGLPGSSLSADPAPCICHPRAARVDAVVGLGHPRGLPTCVAEQCSALFREREADESQRYHSARAREAAGRWAA